MFHQCEFTVIHLSKTCHPFKFPGNIILTAAALPSDPNAFSRRKNASSKPPSLLHGGLDRSRARVGRRAGDYDPSKVILSPLLLNAAVVASR